MTNVRKAIVGIHLHAASIASGPRSVAVAVSLPREPWWFGEPAFKATSFYLRGLPPLVETDRLTPPKAGTEAHKAWSRVHRMPPGPDRWKERSRTFEGIAEAMADQWGGALFAMAAE